MYTDTNLCVLLCITQMWMNALEGHISALMQMSLIAWIKKETTPVEVYPADKSTNIRLYNRASVC